MSDNSHIDKIFKEGIGERSFSNTDAMWQKMDAALENDNKQKRRPLMYVVLVAVLLVSCYIFVKYSNPSTVSSNKEKLIAATNREAEKIANASAQISSSNIADNKTNDIIPASRHLQAQSDNAVENGHLLNNTSSRNAFKTKANTNTQIITASVFSMDDEENGLVNNISQNFNDEVLVEDDMAILEKVSVGATGISSDDLKQPNTVSIPGLLKVDNKLLADKGKRQIVKPKKITVELVAGRDFLRMNRKAGSYIGVRINRMLDNNTAITAGLSYATHIVFDSYRLSSKPSDQKTWDARLNNIASVRLPIYLQSTMGKSKLSMMIGLVPTYITHAEVYNVPDAYTGNPEPYRKFTLNDLNRFNVLFGAGLKYAPTKWFALELSGNYSLTGMVKDGYKNQSRVNDNFKSLQAGVAFRLW